MLANKNLKNLLHLNNRLMQCTHLSTKPFYYQELFEHAKPLNTPFKKLTADYVSTFDVKGKQVLQVEPQGLTLLAEQAFIDIAHLLRPAHLQVN
jgi:fumarate hydratase class I